MRTIIYALMILSLVCFANAETGQHSGEINLDTANQFKETSHRSGLDVGYYLKAGAVKVQEITSSLYNTVARQFENKEDAQNQNVEVDVAKKNLENSKKNVTMMFSYIVATLTVFFDALISIVYILLIVVTVWIVFIGYVKFLIMIIDFVSGRIEERGLRK